ncbi:HTH domain-containing protein [Phycisphaera mikurensis]|uniref:Uncharacterized protein n=1 Tax=Phycisphaera mikurensis (strain NBRC 102666 / KCTC 22515 / FYK2301M01) TaxID=1142394 RepID=I0IF60_PHYMF|nr:HTH domain-containing protein [Phycisphaera mikurensis]MBB6440706.1 hypothetical protein [Phycisphaera mikurensis]BAM03898.1 hypothetical protein PSMK_17390 [Phycisphaera mikurensis NBRC 102666]
MAKKRTWPEAIEQVLRDEGGPLHYVEITERIVAGGLKETSGATPAATVAANLSTSLHNDPKTPFVRAGKPGSGLFRLRTSGEPAPEPVATDEQEAEPQYRVISSFGMYWAKENVDWTLTRPPLLGEADGATKQVNFHDQQGVYLLYDGREVIYVGRSEKDCIGARLRAHTRNRLARRWDRFSWFGVRPVTEAGKLIDVPGGATVDAVVPALEAVLIEALEPRQNFQRGDGLKAVEYVQVVDPKLKKKRLMQSLAEI